MDLRRLFKRRKVKEIDKIMCLAASDFKEYFAEKCNNHQNFESWDKCIFQYLEDRDIVDLKTACNCYSQHQRSKLFEEIMKECQNFRNIKAENLYFWEICKLIETKCLEIQCCIIHLLFKIGVEELYKRTFPIQSNIFINDTNIYKENFEVNGITLRQALEIIILEDSNTNYEDQFIEDMILFCSPTIEDSEFL